VLARIYRHHPSTYGSNGHSYQNKKDGNELHQKLTRYIQPGEKSSIGIYSIEVEWRIYRDKKQRKDRHEDNHRDLI
jgi:hypothetical protein